MMEKGIFTPEPTTDEIPGMFGQIWNVLTGKPAIPVVEKKLGLPEAEVIFDGYPGDPLSPSIEGLYLLKATSRLLGAKFTLPEEAAQMETQIQSNIALLEAEQSDIITETNVLIAELEAQKQAALDNKANIVAQAAEKIGVKLTHAKKAAAVAKFLDA